MFAEQLLDLADDFGGSELLIVNRCRENEIAIFKLALKLRERKVIAFRAMVENWSRDRLIRELN